MTALFADGSLAKTAEDAAPLVGCSESLLRDAVTARRIQHRRLGTQRGVVFTREDIEAFLDQCVVPVQDELPVGVADINTKRKASA
jgi:hypothetical protein